MTINYPIEKNLSEPDFKDQPTLSKKPTAHGWNLLIDAWTTSGVSIAAFCKVHQVNASTFHYWLGKRKKKENPIAFAKVKTPLENAPMKMFSTFPTITLQLSSGMKLTFREELKMEKIISLIKELNRV